MTMTSSLTPEQLKAVTFLPSSLIPCVKKNLIIEAGAGSGKTKVLSERVKWLLTQAPVHCRINPSQIFLVTFTNDAQKELKERIDSVLSSPFLEQTKHLIHISTIDGLFDSLVDCLFPLWWEQNQLGQKKMMPPIITLVSEQEVQRSLEKKVKDFLNSNNYTEYELALAIDFILSGGFKKRNENFYSSATTLENILKCMCQDFFLTSNEKNIRIVTQKIHPATNSLISKIHTLARLEYGKRIQKGEFTYADKTVFLKENLHKNLPIFIKELIVDEYQDTNSLQHEILCKLVENSQGRMVVVGDPKQSIYGFRGASVNVFKSLIENESWEHIVLNKSFRTHEKLLEEINILSRFAFSWKNPRQPQAYKESFFHEEAQKKYICENPLSSGKISNPHENSPAEHLNPPFVYIVTTSIPAKTKEKILSPRGVTAGSKQKSLDSAVKPRNDEEKLKVNELSLLAYADFLKEIQIKEGFKWSELVVLCEKNSQVKLLREAFLKFNLPVKNIEDAEKADSVNYEDRVALALTKCLSGKADSFDLYIILMSPLINAPYEEVYIFMSGGLNESTHPFIKKFFILLEEFKLIAIHNFFLAWQRMRWNLAHTSKNVIFCASMDAFAKALFAELLNTNTRILLEDSIYDGQKQNFVLADNLNSYTLKKPKEHISNQEDAIDIKTIHKAKGLEWPYVCFYPKYGMQMQTGEFITSQSHNTLDISWLNQDTEGLSVVKRVVNINFNQSDSFIDENEKVFRFAEIRKQQEENYERQRVFYTAFTRPQKKLIFFQPALHHSSKNGLKQLANEKKEIEFYDYLEQDVFVKYLKNNFTFTSLENEAPLKEVFYSHNKTVKLTHYNLKELNYSLNSMLPTEILKPQMSLPEFSHLSFLVYPQDATEESNKVTLDSPKNNETGLRWQSISEKLLQKKEQREKIHAGILYHASVENKKVNTKSIVYDLEKNSLICRREIEIWSKEENIIPGSRILKSKRNIIDMLIVLSTHHFFEIFPEYKILGLCNSLLTQNKDYIALAIDFKTGQKTKEHVDQVLNYRSLTQLLLAQNHLTEEIRNWEKIYILGALIYTRSQACEALYSKDQLINPTLVHHYETIYLFQE